LSLSFSLAISYLLFIGGRDFFPRHTHAGEMIMAMSAERKARRLADRQREKYLSKLTPIAGQVKVTDAAKDEIEVELLGAKVTGYINCVNALLEKAGFRPVKITSNMLNPSAGHWCVDINTPGYLDPGSEAYHSM
jgi:hypothetical protein